MHNWFVYDTFDHASRAAADYIADSIDSAVRERGHCYFILPGGNTPRHCLGYLSERDLPWDKVHWFLGDERCYPENHPDRNDVMLNRYLWSHIARTNIYPVAAELGPEVAADNYRAQVDKVDVFDIAFLGVGGDGHTASLFPGNEALNDPRSVVPVYHSPKPPGTRVSLGINTLKNTRIKIILAGGAEKSGILARVKAGENLPVNRLGDINWFIDGEAEK